MLYKKEQTGQVQRMQACDWQVMQIDDAQLQEIAEYLRGLVQNKHYKVGDSFIASDLVGQKQFEWKDTPLNYILQNYATTNAQKNILGKILKRALFDASEKYKLLVKHHARYTLIE